MNLLLIRLRFLWTLVERVLHTFHVISDFKYDVLLGSDILEAIKAKIDFETQTIAIEKNIDYFWMSYAL